MKSASVLSHVIFDSLPHPLGGGGGPRPAPSPAGEGRVRGSRTTPTVGHLTSLRILILVSVVAASVTTGAPKTMSRMKELTTMQKMERKRLKMQERAWSRSFHGRRIPRAERALARGQYRTYMRNLRRQQREQREQLRNQLRLERVANRSDQL
jgi:hypothetical protein